MRIAITTPTGHIGSRALEKVLAAGADVTVLVRDPAKLPATVRSKVKAQQGNLEDGAFVARALEGAEAVLWVMPPAFAVPDLAAHMMALATNAANALRQNHVPRLVLISSHGAGQPKLGAVTTLGAVEQLLASACPNTVFLRAGSFMENLLGALPMLKQGLLPNVGSADASLPRVATRDVGDVAARWLLDGHWTGHKIVGVHGPADLSATEMAAILSRALGKPIAIQPVPPEAVEQQFLKMGASTSVAATYKEMMATFNAPTYRGTEQRSAETTTPTSLEQFAGEVLKPMVQG